MQQTPNKKVGLHQMSKIPHEGNNQWSEMIQFTIILGNLL